MVIWKTTLYYARHEITVPQGSQFLTVQMQHGEPQLWFLCDPEADKEKRAVEIFGTGNPMPTEPGEYISTFQDGRLVFHVFDTTKGK